MTMDISLYLKLLLVRLNFKTETWSGRIFPLKCCFSDIIPEFLSFFLWDVLTFCLQQSQEPSDFPANMCCYPSAAHLWDYSALLENMIGLGCR